MIIPMSESETTSELLGQIADTQLDVRQKFQSDYSWQKTVANTSVSVGDSLFTGPKSSCEITLEDGKKLTIAENSLIRFSKKNKRLSIDLAFGKLSASGLTTELDITDCGQAVKINPNGSKFELSKSSQCGSMDIAVKEGEIKVNSRQVSKIKPKAKKIVASFFNDKVQIAEIFKAKKVEPVVVNLPEVLAPPVVELVPPAAPAFVKNKFTALFDQKAKVDLRWSASTSAEKYFLEISDSANFVKSETVQVNDTSYTFKPTRDGSYFFRLKAAAANGLESSLSEPARAQFSFPAIELQQKQIQADYKARGPKDFGGKKSFPVSWSPINSAAKYVVDLDQKSDFSNPTQFSSRSPASAIEVPRTGDYNYRVTAYDKKGRKISSTSEPGQISYQRLFNIAAPVIEASLKSISYYFQKGLGQFIWLRWNQASVDLKNIKYHVQISSSDQFTNLTLDAVTAKNKFLMNNNLSQGTYFWRVRSEAPDQFSEWSDIGSIKVQTKKVN